MKIGVVINHMQDQASGVTLRYPEMRALAQRAEAGGGVRVEPDRGEVSSLEGLLGLDARARRVAIELLAECRP